MSADDTRRRILDAAIEVISTKGEAAVRVVDVAKRAGVTQGMVTYHFGTRTNLVIEAQTERFRGTLLDDARLIATGLETASGLEAVMAIGRQMTELMLSEERNVQRRSRLNALGYVAGHSDAWGSLRASATESADAMEANFAKIAAMGHLRPGVTPRAAATMASAFSFGLVQSLFDDKRPSNDELAEVMIGFIRSLFVE